MPRACTARGQMNEPAYARFDRLENRAREVGGVRGPQALIGHDAQRALLAPAGDHALNEVPSLARAAVSSVQARASNNERVPAVREREILARELRDRIRRVR